MLTFCLQSKNECGIIYLHLVSKYRREAAKALHRNKESWSAKSKYVNIAWIYMTGT